MQRYSEGGAWKIKTKSSRPHSHPHEIDQEIVDCIVRKRQKRKRCAEVIHKELKNESVDVSLSSVKRTLDRKGMTKK
jgi:IS30 family transposase